MADEKKTRRPPAQGDTEAVERQPMPVERGPADADRGLAEPERGPERVRTPAELELTELVAGQTTILSEITDSFRWRAGMSPRNGENDPDSGDSAGLDTDEPLSEA